MIDWKIMVLNEVHIREFRPNDAKRISAIIRKNFRWFNKIRPGWVHAGVNGWMQGNTSKELVARHQTGQTRFFVAEAKGRLVGIVGLTSDLGNGSTTAKLVNFYVHPDYQKKGIGRKLVDALESYAAGLGKTRIILFGALPTHDAYTTLGFQHHPDRDVYVNRSKAGEFLSKCSCGHVPDQKGRIDQYFFEKTI